MNIPLLKTAILMAAMLSGLTQAGTPMISAPWRPQRPGVPPRRWTDSLCRGPRQLRQLIVRFRIRPLSGSRSVTGDR